MQNLDYIVLVMFTALIFASGLSFYKSGSSVKSFFAAGGAVPWWLSGLSLFMSFFSAGTFVIWGSVAYEYGWVAVTIQWMMGLGGFAIAYFIAPRWKKANILTVAEYITRKFGEKARVFYSYTFLFLSITYTGAFLYPVAKLINVSTPLSIELSIVLLGLIIIIYTAVGGLWAVMITDVLQFVILCAGVLIVVPLAFDHIGGLGQLFSVAPPGFFDLTNDEYTVWFLIAFAVYNTAFIGGNWAYVQRYTSVSTVQDAKKVGLLFGGLYLISPVLWMVPPMVYQLVNSGGDRQVAEGAFLLMSQEVLPAGILGLMLGGMIFATASSVNTTLNTSAAVFTNDIFKKIFPSSSVKALVKAGRVSTAIFGVMTILFAFMVPSMGGIVEVVLSIGAITGVPLYGPPIFALFSKKQTEMSIITVTVLSLIINVFFKFFAADLLNISLDRTQEMILGVLAPIIILLIFELSGKPVGVSQPTQSNSEVEPEEDDSTGANAFAIKMIAWITLIIGVVIILLGAMAETGRLESIIVGVLLLIAGILIKESGTGPSNQEVNKAIDSD